MPIEIRPLSLETVPGAVALQAACFPPPFDPDLLWKAEHLARHLEIFPEGQFVAMDGDFVAGSSTSVRISEENWQAHNDWETTVGGHFLNANNPSGTTLYGVDVSVHPEYRGRGIGRMLYAARFDLVRQLGLIRYGTACRIPDWHRHSENFESKLAYCKAVTAGDLSDRTLTPLLRYGLNLVDVIEDYMEDEESGNAAALLEWRKGYPLPYNHQDHQGAQRLTAFS